MCVFQNGCLSERQAPGPVLEQIAEMTLNIKAVRTIGRYWNSRTSEYPETHALLKVRGVGYITVLTYVLPLGSKERFKRSRDVGCYLGLRPRRSQSGERDPQLGITKVGNVYLRSPGPELDPAFYFLRSCVMSCS
jgi:transposase